MSDFVHDSIFKDAFLRASHHYIDALELPDIHTRRSSDARRWWSRRPSRWGPCG